MRQAFVNLDIWVNGRSPLTIDDFRLTIPRSKLMRRSSGESLAFQIHVVITNGRSQFVNFSNSVSSQRPFFPTNLSPTTSQGWSRKRPFSIR
ncbi:MAG: hypothetical protein M5U34_42310 [Chloroflexi bacterium]|nr:hypothetical protein [Chloroflexota bacterium]